MNLVFPEEIPIGDRCSMISVNRKEDSGYQYIIALSLKLCSILLFDGWPITRMEKEVDEMHSLI